jgi:hypothetical protein
MRYAGLLLLALTAFVVGITRGQTVDVTGTGFHRRLAVTLDAVPVGTVVPVRVRFGRAYFVDPFEATDVAKATLRGAALSVPVRTRPERLDLEAPEFSALAADSPVAELLLRPREPTVSFDLAMHGRYPVPVPVPDQGTAKQSALAHTGPFCADIAIGDGEYRRTCAPGDWALPRGDAELLPALYWSTISLMALGCGTVMHALIRS